MKLPDFLEFEPFNRMRASLGAEQLGAFEFFEPQLHLTAREREELLTGLTLGWSALRCLHDYTLAYKNSRVLVWGQAPGQSWAAPGYHLAYCRTLQQLRRQQPDLRLAVATRLPEPDPWPWRVCPECLQQLQFRGFDAARTRHRDYSERVLEAFDLADFFRDYPVYPITSEVLRALDVVA
ncbi:hypothetical protein [Marinimicrobium koreense]|uniref:hypothetical protein n=1 Tax=Marinimicrobium koreense TaxID=306545 RepID=UPI003F6E659C